MSNFFRNIHPLLRRNKRPEKYDDTNFAVLNALNYELTQAEQETIASKIQSSLESATDTYLDTWGDWFGVYRKDGWDDEYYRARIIRELLLKRGTIPAIIDALVDFLNDNDAVVQIYEPWRNIFYTNKSKLNGDDHLMGYYYRFAIIDISIDRPFPPEIVEIIKAFKPAGVLFYLRLDTSLDKNKTTVESPYVYLDVTNKTELEFLNGLYYDLRGNINLSDQRTQVVGNNIFHTNNSKLNGEDVLAGAFNHGRGYVHLASTTLLDYTPKATDSMSNLKTTLGEAGSDMYNQTKEKDGRTASIQVPATKNVHTLYSNSLDFGDYDYSGNPNLFLNPTFSDLSSDANMNTPVKSFVTDNGESFTVDLTEVTGEQVFYFNNLPTMLKNTAYTYSIEAKADIDLPKGIRVRPVYIDENSRTQYVFPTIIPNMTTSYKRYSYTHLNLPLGYLNSNFHSLQFYFPADVPRTKITIKYNIKIEKGSAATPYQPNLLDAPYYLSKVPLGENIADPKKVFPIKTSAYNIYLGKNTEKYQLNQTYTITMKATKPATQQFSVFLLGGAMGVGNMKPVEGLTDVWELTFKVTQAHIDAGITDVLSLYQLPQSTVGACQIDWLKIEKGDTRTPNIDSYDYVGSLIEDTETPTLDPTKYTWTVNGDVTNKKAYMVFDIKTFIEENYATEFEKLVADLGEDQALNAVFENFNISTALKALVSPSSPINFSVELYDFSTSAWHKLNTDSLDLRMRTFNLVANRITDYLNDYKLLFVRYVFDNETDKDVTVELDMLNILFKYRLGDGYSLGLQSTVECLSEIPLKRLALSSESVEVAIGETAKVTATPVPANATNKSLEWEIADPKTATVDTSGNITGVAIGETTSTVYGEDRTISATCSVSVKARHTLYSNSTDFGAYDYSGNPNLIAKLKSPDFNSGYHGSITDVDGRLHFTSDGTGSISMFTRINTPALASGKTYTLSAKVRFDEGTTGAIDKLRLVYRTSPGEKILLEANSTNITTDDVGKEITIKGTANVNYQITNVERFYMTVSFANFDKINGGFKLYDIKIEEGSTATPYQPNLLDAPYYLSNVPLGENIANKAIQFPIKSSEYLLYKANMEEEYILGQTYTITLKGTKPASQTFIAYNDGVISFGNLKPVEGLTDVWSLTFTPTKIASNVPKEFRIFQYPSSTVGTCQIDWLKIEKGDTRTPNIDSYAYRGTVLTASEEAPTDPNAYTWSSI